MVHPFKLPWHVDMCVCACAPSMWGALQRQPQLDEDYRVRYHTDGRTSSTIWCGWLLPPLHSPLHSTLSYQSWHPGSFGYKVRNTRVGGLLVCAPPCSTWVFLSSCSTGRGWSNPGGNSQRCVQLANIMVRRLLLHATWLIHMIFHIEIHKQKLYIFPYVELRLFYAIKRNLKIVIEQPGSSVPCFQKGSDGYRWANETTMNNQIENKITWTHCYIVPVRTPYGETYP